MPKGHSLRLTAAAAAELGRQAAVAGTPGVMHIDLIDGSCERWVIRIRPGHLAGVAMAISKPCGVCSIIAYGARH